MLFIIWKGKGACKKSPIGIRTHDLQILTFALRNVLKQNIYEFILDLFQCEVRYNMEIPIPL